MGWLSERRRDHYCVLPNLRAGGLRIVVEAGSMWECDECNKRWVVMSPIREGLPVDDVVWVPLENWLRVTQSSLTATEQPSSMESDGREHVSTGGEDGAGTGKATSRRSRQKRES